jgi:hypothetical protein
MSLDDATDATPRQMGAFIEAAGPTRIAITTAWHAEFFTRQTKLKPLEAYLPRAAEAAPRRPSGQERAAFARAEAAAWNARVARREQRQQERQP